MDNSQKYHFNDFSLRSYRSLLKLAKKHYEFAGYNDLKKDKIIILRHDIDISVDNALKLAKIEMEEKIKSIYFVNLHSDYYNILEKRNTDIIKEILSLGHSVGLHFDPHFYHIQTETELVKYLRFDKSVLEKFFKIHLNVFSYHNTDEKVLSYDKLKYAGMINTYSRYIKNNFGYCSDSNGYWRYERLNDVLISHKDNKLQILLHPEWWQEKVDSPKGKIFNCIEKEAGVKKKNYIETLKSFNRKIIDWQDK